MNFALFITNQFQVLSDLYVEWVLPTCPEKGSRSMATEKILDAINANRGSFRGGGGGE